MHLIKTNAFNFPRQRGAALFIALMFLLILTLLGLTSSNVGIMQERMSANTADYNLAFQRAEAVVREVEFELSQPFPSLSNVVEWGSVSNLRMRPSDCSLESNIGADWADLAGLFSWSEAPTAPGDYVVIELGEYLDAGDLRRISCRLEDGLTTETGEPIIGEHYLILARAFGEGDQARRARVVVQSIFWWPP